MIQIEPEQFLDPRWRLSNLYTITDKTGTRVPFQPNTAQLALLDDLHSANIILLGNYAGLVPGLMAPTSDINVTVGCAITTWVYYHFQGFKKQGVVNYLKHFAVPPGAPVWMAPMMLIIELISHSSRLLSLSLRLFAPEYQRGKSFVQYGSRKGKADARPQLFLTSAP